MKIIRIILTMAALLATTHAWSMTCTPGDWDKELCDLPEIPGTRCAEAKFFRTYCAPGTVGCAEVGGCIGATPVGHWYPIIGETGVPKWKCRCGCFAQETLFASNASDSGYYTGSELIYASEKGQVGRISVKSLDSIGGTSFTDRPINGVRFGPEAENALTFTTDRGRSITLSQAHPVVILDATGKLLAMKAAATVVVGDYLQSGNGEADRVVSIDSKSYQGRMVNFNVESD